MYIILFTVFIIIWFLIGAIGYIYWWTNKFDYTTDDIPLTILNGLAGPFGLYISWSVCGDIESRKVVLIGKRDVK